MQTLIFEGGWSIPFYENYMGGTGLTGLCWSKQHWRPDSDLIKLIIDTSVSIVAFNSPLSQAHSTLRWIRQWSDSLFLRVPDIEMQNLSGRWQSSICNQHVYMLQVKAKHFLFRQSARTSALHPFMSDLEIDFMHDITWSLNWLLPLPQQQIACTILFHHQ